MKPAKRLWRMSITTTLEAEDAVAELLRNSLGRDSSAYWDVERHQSVVSVFGRRAGLAARTARKLIAAGLNNIRRCGLDTGAAKVRIARVPREDWAESWKRHFRPIDVGGALLIKPSWIKRAPRRGQKVVVLDPGLSFGTGNHATTSFCLGEIVRHRPAAADSDTRRRGSRGAAATVSLLDIGTGSGILAIGASKLGYRPVQAIDFDPDAVRVARSNARLNRVARNITIRRQNVARLPSRPGRKFDLVCANLMAGLLIAERRRILAQLKPGGWLILAGILLSEFPEVQRTFENLGLRLARARTEREWRSGAFRFAESGRPRRGGPGGR